MRNLLDILTKSVYRDPIAAAWWGVVAVAVLAILFVLGPWSLGHAFRRRGKTPPTWGRRIGACLLAGLVSGVAGWIAAWGVVLAIRSTCTNTRPAEPMALISVISAVFLAGWAGALVTLGASPGSHTALPYRAFLLTSLLVVAAQIAVYACDMWSMTRTRELPKRTVDGVILNGIGKGLQLYHDDHDAYPDDLRRLVDERMMGGNALLPLNSPNRFSPLPTTRPYAGPCDFHYLPRTMGAKERLACVWADPSFYDGEGGWMLYNNGEVQWLKPQDLQAQVDKSREWIKAHPAPESMPAGK